MYLQLLIAVNVMSFAAMILASYLLRRDWSYAWAIAVQVFVLAAGAAAIKLEWEQPGTLVAGLFGVLFVLPATLAGVSHRKAAMGNAKLAALYMKWASWVQPAPSVRLMSRIMSAQAIPDPASSSAALRNLAGGVPARQATTLQALAFRAEDKWDKVLEAIDEDPGVAKSLAVLKIRSLGEIGRIAGMVAEYQRARTLMPADERYTAELFVLAFAGRMASVSIRLDKPKPPYDADTCAYWKAIAARNSGTRDDSGLAALAQTAQRPATRVAAARHLKTQSFNASSLLSADAAQAVDGIEKRLARLSALAARPLRRCYAVIALVLANCIMFGVELSHGGAEDLPTLFDLGALWPPSVLSNGEWWRLASALFLHFGWPHFVINMISLLALGRAVETRFGSWRLLVIYLAGGIGSSAAVLGLMHAGYTPQSLLIGASGAVMALFGALLAYQVADWRRSRDVLDRRPVLALCAIVALQVAIDLSMLQVSLAAHLSGFVLGFIVALALSVFLPSQAQRRSGSV